MEVRFEGAVFRAFRDYMKYDLNPKPHIRPYVSDR